MTTSTHLQRPKAESVGCMGQAVSDSRRTVHTDIWNTNRH